MRLSAQATQLADTSQAAQAEWSGKTGNFRRQAELPEKMSPCSELGMADDPSLTRAVDTAWSIYRATHSGVDAADGRRCLLERHLYRRWEAHGGDVEELTGFGIAFLARLPEQEC
jgi:hypothetical protein